MKYQVLSILFLICFFSQIAFSQNKPAWIASVENTIQQKEPAWKLENKKAHSESGSYSFSFTFKSNEHQATIQIDRMKGISNAEETFAGQVISFDQTMGKNKKKTMLKNFGNEGFIWINPTGDSWTTIHFRKSDIFVYVYASSEKTARMFSQYVVEQMP